MYKITISYRDIKEDVIKKATFEDLTLNMVYSLLNDYAISSIFELLEALIVKS